MLVVVVMGERTSESTPTPPTSIFGSVLRSTTVGLVIVITIFAFESTAVSTALPTAARALHDVGAYGWAFTGFLVANIVGLVTSGMVSDSRGARPPLVAGLVTFAVGLVIAGSAVTMTQLIAGRVVQGLGSGMVLTALYVVIGQVYPERLRGPVFAAISSAWIVPSLVGPLIAGLLAEHVGWRWVFLGLVPFVIVGGLLLVPVLRTLNGGTGNRLLTGRRKLGRAAAVAVGIALLEQAGQHPSALSVAGAAIGLTLFGWGVRRLLPTGTLRVRPGVSAPVALRGLLAGSFFAIEATIPLMLTQQHGFTATEAGLPLAVTGISWALGSWWQGRVDDSAGPHRRIGLLRAGFALIALAATCVAVVSMPGVPGWLVFPAWLPAGLGAGLAMSSTGVLLLKFTTDADRGADSSALQLADAGTSALTTGVAGVLVAAATRGAISSTAGFVILDLMMGGLALLGAVVAGRARAAA